MAPKLYMRKRSPPCVSVLLTAKALGIQLQEIEITLEDSHSPAFVKLNPQHTVPTLEDGDKIIWESHAINIYLVAVYGKDDALYPNDPYKRAIVNQRMHFNCGVVFAAAKQIRDLIVINRVKTLTPESIERMEQSYAFLEKFLDGNDWIAGNVLTLADFSLIPTISHTRYLVPIDNNRFPKVCAWLEKAEKLPYFDIVKQGMEEAKTFYTSYMNQ